MPDGRGPWTVKKFEEQFEAWADRDDPSLELRIVVAEWTLSRMEDPYEGATREPGLPNLWSAVVRGSATGRPGNIRVVLSVFWINESDRSVVFTSFATLSHPV